MQRAEFIQGGAPPSLYRRKIMHRYKIFLKIGETVEVKAEAVKVVHDVKGNIFRLDFVNYDLNNIIRVVAMFYAEDISSWTELPESEDKS